MFNAQFSMFNVHVLNRIDAAQVSNLRGEAANWKQEKLIRITEAGNIKKQKSKNKNQEPTKYQIKKLEEMILNLSFMTYL